MACGQGETSFKTSCLCSQFIFMHCLDSNALQIAFIVSFGSDI